MNKSNERAVNTGIALFILLTLLISSIALASTEEAENKVKFVFNKIESSLSTLKDKNDFSKNNIKSVLNTYLLPEVETKYFSNKVLNKNLVKLDDNLKAEFEFALANQLINTYSNLLSNYSNETIIINQGTLSKSGKIAMVNITVEGKSKSNKAVVKLIKSSDESWKFFDIVLEGVSIVDSKQVEINSSFNKLGAKGTLDRFKNINSK